MACRSFAGSPAPRTVRVIQYASASGRSLFAITKFHAATLLIAADWPRYVLGATVAFARNGKRLSIAASSSSVRPNTTASLAFVTDVIDGIGIDAPCHNASM